MNLYKLIYFILAVIFAKCKNTMRVASASPTTTLFSKYPSLNVPCGGILTEKHGILQTPNFPNPFNVPISCVWIIDASSFWGSPNASIFVYLTQQYVLSGLSFKEYMYYRLVLAGRFHNPTLIILSCLLATVRTSKCPARWRRSLRRKTLLGLHQFNPTRLF